MSEQTPENIQGLIRRFCDGELDAERAAEIERRIATEPDLADRVRFERAFRSRVVRIMEADAAPAPADLAPRILAAMRAVDAAALGSMSTNSVSTDPVSTSPTSTGSTPTRSTSTGSTSTGSTSTRSTQAAASEDATDVPEPRRSRSGKARSSAPWFVGPPRANIFAVAATLAVIAGAVLFGIFGRPIDSIRSARVEPVTEIAQFVSTEHRRCASDPDARGRKTKWTDPSACAAGLRDLLGVDVPIFEVESYRFVGAGPCHVPGEPVSAHLVYVRNDSGGDGHPSVMLSLFVVPNHGQFARDVTGGGRKWAWSNIGDRPECPKTVACCDDGRLIYFLVCCNDFEVPALADEIGREGIARTGD